MSYEVLLDDESKGGIGVTVIRVGRHGFLWLRRPEIYYRTFGQHWTRYSNGTLVGYGDLDRRLDSVIRDTREAVSSARRVDASVRGQIEPLLSAPTDAESEGPYR